MDKNIILLALNLALFILNLWMINRTLVVLNDTIKRDEDLITEIAKVMGEAMMNERSEE